MEWSSGVVEWSSGVVEWSSRVVEWSSRIVEWSSERAKLLLGKDLYAQILVEFMKHFASTFQYLSSHISKDLLCTDFGRICETFCIKKTLCLFWSDSFRYSVLASLEPRSSTRNNLF